MEQRGGAARRALHARELSRRRLPNRDGGQVAPGARERPHASQRARLRRVLRPSQHGHRLLDAQPPQGPRLAAQRPDGRRAGALCDRSPGRGRCADHPPTGRGQAALPLRRLQRAAQSHAGPREARREIRAPAEGPGLPERPPAGSRIAEGGLRELPPHLRGDGRLDGSGRREDPSHPRRRGHRQRHDRASSRATTAASTSSGRATHR